MIANESSRGGSRVKRRPIRISGAAIGLLRSAWATGLTRQKRAMGYVDGSENPGHLRTQNGVFLIRNNVFFMV